ncbi:MAG: hypothetical protein P8X93_00650 [Gammaproteobacteria bacterium]
MIVRSINYDLRFTFKNDFQGDLLIGRYCIFGNIFTTSQFDQVVNM